MPIGATAGAFTLAIAVVVRTRVLPVWTAWIGLLSTVLGVISVLVIIIAMVLRIAKTELATP